MNKTKEHGSDVHQKIVELHKIESGCKKIAKELKIPILTIWTIFICWRSWTSCSDTWYYGFYQIQKDKK